MIHIPHIQLKLLRPRDSIASMTLCPARDIKVSPHDDEPALCYTMGDIALGAAGPYQSHVTFQHIDQLR